LLLGDQTPNRKITQEKLRVSLSEIELRLGHDRVPFAVVGESVSDVSLERISWSIFSGAYGNASHLSLFL
jgi:hypothetical protein